MTRENGKGPLSNKMGVKCKPQRAPQILEMNVSLDKRKCRRQFLPLPVERTLYILKSIEEADHFVGGKFLTRAVVGAFLYFAKQFSKIANRFY